jgi:hypothetical protein
LKDQNLQKDVDYSEGSIPKLPDTERFNRSQLDEADTRRLQRGIIFVTIYVAAVYVFGAFVVYTFKLIHGAKLETTPMLLWLLAIMPIALILLMMKLAAEPAKVEDKPAGLGSDIVAIFQELAAALKDFLKSKTG